MSDQNDRVRAIAQLEREIATLQQTIDGLAALPAAQQSLRPQLAEKQRELAVLRGGGVLPPVTQTQSSGINFGVGTSIGTIGDVFTGDKVMGDKFSGNKTVNHGPTFNGPVRAGRDVNAATNQTITNAAPPPPPAPVTEVANTPGPRLRLWLEDLHGEAIATLAVGEEAVLRLGVDGDAASLPTLALQAEAEAADVAWPDGTSRPLMLKPGATLRAARWTIIPQEAGALTLRVLVLAAGALVQQLALTATVVEAGGTLSAEQTALAQPQFAAPVGLALGAVAALPRHAAALTLVIDQEREGYELRLIEGGRITRCRLALTPHGVADLLAHARSELLALVYMTEGNTNVFQQPDLTISQAVAEQALARLARLGAYLWNSLFDGPSSGPDSAALGAQLRRLSQEASLYVTVAAAHLPFPWPLLYDRDLSEPITADGFWGFRHVLATLPTSGRSGMLPTGLSLGAAHELRALVGFNLRIDQHRGVPPRQVIAPQRAALAALDITTDEVTTEAALSAALAAGSDAALVYLYCHVLSGLPEQRAQRPGTAPAGVGSTRFVLTEGKNALTLRDLEINAPLSRAPLLHGGPLVVLNACGSAELSPLTYDGLAPYLLDQGARAVVGTECETPIFFGAAFGPALLQLFIKQRLPIGEALRATRRQFLEQHHNPLGLLYALYGSAELAIDTPEQKDVA